MTIRATIMVAIIIIAAVPCIHASECFAQQFVREAINQGFLKYVGRHHAPDAITQTDCGLLIKIPSNLPGKKQMGVASKFMVVGDFEITAGYELVDVKQPENGYGAGVMLRLFKADGRYRCVNHSRFKVPSGENVFATNVWSNVKGEQKGDSKKFPAESDHGQIRLVRSGTTLTFLVADGSSEKFHEVRRVNDFGPEPLMAVQLLGDTGRSEQPITVRLTHLAVCADELPFGLLEPHRQMIWGIWTIFGLLGMSVVVIGSVMWYRRQRR